MHKKYPCISWHKAVDIVVDLLEDKATIHESKTALRIKIPGNTQFYHFTDININNTVKMIGKHYKYFLVMLCLNQDQHR